MEVPVERKIAIAKSESKVVLTLIAHLRNIVEMVFDETWQRRHPLEMDQASILMCAASLRTLFFDDSPSPVLLDFFEKHDVSFKVDAFESDLAMLFFAQVEPRDEGHIVDFFLQKFYGKDAETEFELDVPKKILISLVATNDVYTSLANVPQVWKPTNDSVPNSMFPPDFPGGAPTQYFTITRRQVPVAEWGSLTVGYLKHIPIRRRTIICYVANKLGAVHYDASRFFSDKDVKAEFKLLAEAYDWDSDAIMHAGLVVVALACLELTNNPTLVFLLLSCIDFEKDRIRRLQENFASADSHNQT